MTEQLIRMRARASRHREEPTNKKMRISEDSNLQALNQPKGRPMDTRLGEIILIASG